MPKKKRYWIILLTILLFTSPALALASDGSLFDTSSFFQSLGTEKLTGECLSYGDCTPCDFVVIGIRLTRFILGIGGAAALLLFVTAGFILIISTGASALREKSKTIIKGVLVGLAIVFLAWTGVNLFLSAMISTNSISAVTADAGDTPKALVFGKQWTTLTCAIPKHPTALVHAPETTSALSLENISTCGIKEEQKDYVTPELKTALEKLDETVTSGTSCITSIIDDQILNGNCSQSCSATSCQKSSACSHKATCSCHYGGCENFDKNNPPYSYAVDLQPKGGMTYEQLYKKVNNVNDFQKIICEGTYGGEYIYDTNCTKVNDSSFTITHIHAQTKSSCS